MDPEILAQLEGSGSEFEELEDDFIALAAQEIEEESTFDYDAHIRGLLERAGDSNINKPKGYHKGKFNVEHKLNEDSDEEFDSEEFDSDESDEDNSRSKKPNRLRQSQNPKENQRLKDMDDMFEHVLAEYEDSEIGQLDSEDERIKVSYFTLHNFMRKLKEIVNVD